MIKKAETYGCLFVLFLFIFINCKENITTPDTNAFGTLVNYQGCKTFQKDATSESWQHDAQIECIEYEYNGTNALHMKHINAGFNCCPGKIVADISVRDNVIEITEKETEPSCCCLCLFDVDYEFLFLKPGVYKISVKCPCISEGDTALEFTVKLFKPCLGTYCVERTYYPWGN